MNLYQPTISGSLTVSGSVEIIGPFTMSGGSITGTASFAQNSGLLSNLDSGSFVGTGSFNSMSSSVSTRVTKIEGNYATTGSNIFLGAQTVCANITSTGTIVAQTLNVQQVTSSIVYSSGSNVFGNLLTDVQQFTGSLRVTGSTLTVTEGTICAPFIQATSNIRLGTTTSAGNATDPAITTGGCTKVGIYFTGSCVALGSGGNTLILTQTGRVGIGTQQPNYGNLSIVCTDNTPLSSALWGSSAIDGVVTAIYNTSQCTNSVAGIRLVTRSSGASVWNIYNVSVCGDNGDLAFGNGSGGTGTEKLRIFNSGITCFACTVCVGGEMIVKGNAGACNTHYFTTGASNVAKYIQYNASGTAINQIAADAHSYFNSGCRFGIGSNSPTFKLDVQDATQAVIRVLDSTSNNSLILQAGTGAGMKITGYNYNSSTAIPLYISVDGADTIMQRSGGNVGINNTTPCGKLQISLGTVANGCFRTSSGGEAALTIEACGNSYIQFMNCSTGQTGLMFGNECTQYSGMMWYRHNHKQLMLGANGTEIMYLCGGNVGIGTASPEALLHLNKSTVGGEGAFIFLDNPASSTLGNKAGIRFATNAGATFSGYGSFVEAVNTNASNGAEALTFGTWDGGARAERMRITSSGIACFACRPQFPGASLICSYTCTISSYTAGTWIGLFAGDNGFNGAYAFTVVGQFNLNGSSLYSMNYATVPYIHKSDLIGSTNGNSFTTLQYNQSGHADNGITVSFRRAMYTSNTPVGNRTEFCMSSNYNTTFTATTYVLAWV